MTHEGPNLSDLHVDVFPIKPITIVPDVDLVIVAGDTCEGALRAFEHLRRLVPMDIPIVMVMGNHEYYRRFVPDELALARSQAPNFNIRLIENDSVTLGVGGNHGVRFVGATLWTDYGVFGEVKQAAVMNACAKGMNDHRLIGWQKKPWRRFRPQEAAVLHYQSRAYLKDALSKPFNGPSVMITHTAVHRNSVLPRFATDLITGAFVSDLEDLLMATSPALAVHGHVHNSCDYASGIHGFCAIRTGTEMKTPTSTAPWWWRSSEGGRSLSACSPPLCLAFESCPMLTRQFRFLDPARIEPDLARRLRALAGDCERLALGRPVSPILLAKAPLLEDWVPTVTALGVQLVGRVTAIPFRAIAKSPPPPSGLPTLTAPWARTLSRYYRLGRPLHRDALRATRN